jgi:hypothetical protein
MNSVVGFGGSGWGRIVGTSVAVLNGQARERDTPQAPIGKLASRH